MPIPWTYPPAIVNGDWSLWSPGSVNSLPSVGFGDIGLSTWTVPDGVTLVDADIMGAQGGQGGGLGGRMKATLPATPGHVWHIAVGEHGYLQGGTAAYGGGGAGSIGTSFGGPGGGGCTTITNSTTGETLLVAGGGGAAGAFGRAGGSGDYPNGGNGQDDPSGGGSGGKGGTQTAGGVGYYVPLDGTHTATQIDGSAFQGGIAMATGGVTTDNGGAGGGGGYFGGGTGMHWAGGGGGSGYATATATNVSSTGGFQAGNGKATLSPRTSDLPSAFGEVVVYDYAKVTSTATFHKTGLVQSWTVPTGVSRIDIDAYGCPGDGAGHGSQGGLGGRVQAFQIPVTPGEILQIYIGLDGGLGGNASTPAAPGGGSAQVRRSPFAIGDTLVAAGGGGGAGSMDGGAGGNGGPGGHPDGTAGTGAPAPFNPYGQGGGGGTQTAGGAGGTMYGHPEITQGGNGSAGQGGNGFGTVGQATVCGGGGGGGWFGGGGGGTGAGGGGGSSYESGTAATREFDNGVGTDPTGLVMFTWTPV